jgi:hypothetical protein
MNFDLSSRFDRYRARKSGFDIPKRKPGVKRKPFDDYGHFSEKNRMVLAHRKAFELANGATLSGGVVMHTCDTPRCCNPSHLRLGVSQDNTADKMAKNRQSKGESVGTSKLTEEKVRSIRSRYKFRSVTYKMLAKEYGVCVDLVQKIVRGFLWKHI